MTVPSHFSPHHFSSLAPTPPAQKQTVSANEAAPTAAREANAEPSPSLPAGRVGHHVNTTA